MSHQKEAQQLTQEQADNIWNSIYDNKSSLNFPEVCDYYLYRIWFHNGLYYVEIRSERDNNKRFQLISGQPDWLGTYPPYLSGIKYDNILPSESPVIFESEEAKLHKQERTANRFYKEVERREEYKKKFFKIEYGTEDERLKEVSYITYYVVMIEDVEFFLDLYKVRGCKPIEVNSIPLIIDFDRNRI